MTRPGETPTRSRLGAILAAALIATTACAGGNTTTSPSSSVGASFGSSSTVGISHSPEASATPAVTPTSSSGATASTAPSGSASAPPTASPGESSTAAPVPSAGEGEFVNPVYAGNFADPDVIEVGDTFYGYATGNLGYDIGVATSEDLAHWERASEAMAARPDWQPREKGLTWAPEVWKTSAGYLMYYTARDVESDKQCISVAVASEPGGKFVDESTRPFICQTDLGGSIDPSPFQDHDGKRYLVWKNDGNCCGKATKIWIQPLSDDGLKLTGKATETGERNDKPWERFVVEGPTLLQHDGTYFLLYSANAFDTADYAVGYATSESVMGPYSDAATNPVLASKGIAAGPGGQTVVELKDGSSWIFYHAWDVARIGDSVGGIRSMWLDQLLFEGGKLRVDGPDVDPQPAPLGP